MNSLFIRPNGQQQKILKFLIIAGVLSLSLMVGQIFPIKYLPFLLVLTVGFGVLLMYIRNPYLGLLAVISGGMIIEFELGTGTSTSINVVVILLPLTMGVWFVDRFVRQGEVGFVSTRANLPIIGLVIASLLAFGIGQLTWFYYARQAPLLSQLGGLGLFILSAGAFVLTANVVKSIQQLQALTWLFVLVGMIIVITKILPVVGPIIGNYLPSGARGSLFWIWLLAIMFSQLIFNRDLKIYSRLLLTGSIIVILYVSMYLGYSWKSGWIPPLAVIGVITWLRLKKFQVFLIAGGVVIILLIGSELIQSDQYSYVTRVEAWRIILNEIINVNPIFGLGPANYRFYTPLFPIMGYWVEFNSHNNYIDIVAQIGILGLLAFIWLVWEVWILGWRMHKQELGGFGNAYVVGTLGGLIGMLVAGMLGDWVIPFVYNVGLKGFRASVIGWIFLGGLIALQHFTSKARMDSRKEPE